MCQCISSVFWILILILNLVQIPATLSPSWPFHLSNSLERVFSEEADSFLLGLSTKKVAWWYKRNSFFSRCSLGGEQLHQIPGFLRVSAWWRAAPLSGTFWSSPQLAEPLRQCRLWACLKSQMARAYCLLAPVELVSKGQSQHNCSAGIHCIYNGLRFQALRVAWLPSACTAKLLYWNSPPLVVSPKLSFRRGGLDRFVGFSRQEGDCLVTPQEHAVQKNFSKTSRLICL